MFCDIDFGFTFNIKKLDWKNLYKPRNSQHDRPDYTLSRGFYGSLCYTPPEVLGQVPFKPKTGEGFLKADVWALGITFYELITGKTPTWAMPIYRAYEGLKTWETLTDAQVHKLSRAFHNVDVPTEITETLEPMNLPAKLKTLIRSMLAIDPKKRINMREALRLICQLLPKNSPIFEQMKEQGLPVSAS